MEKFTKFTQIAEIEFSDIVLSTQELGFKLRVYLKDKTFLDFFYSANTKLQRFSIHWERAHIDGLIYRIDNTPDKKWQRVETFPIHFHEREYSRVLVPSFLEGRDDDLKKIFRGFLNFVREKLKKESII